MGDSGDFIFARRPDGGLEFKGDFEGLYKSDPDPWGQSGEHPRMKEYYAFSRRRLLLTLNGLPWRRLLEVGCGAGYVAHQIDRSFHPRRRVYGCDVSRSAVLLANEKFPDGKWYQFDIADPDAVRSYHVYEYDVVILGQVLWYVLDHFPAVLVNVMKMLNPGGHLIIQTAFLDNQEYGRDVVDGFNGLLLYMLNTTFQVVSASYDNSGRYAPHHDGLLVLQATHQVH
jgi:2-polyprenyl-3-methyl-5-hydroxy-6-metoxy-1,4-benzoquinol methylase